MHNTLKDVAADQNQANALGVPIGTHILTTVLEGDGAVELASDKATFDAKVISIQRTTSGGIQAQLAVWVIEPAPAAPPVQLSADDQAIAYFVGKGFSATDAKAQVERFGADRVLAQAAKEAAQKQQDLDKELESVLASAPEPATPAVN